MCLEAIKSLKNKNLFIVGGSFYERKSFISKIIELTNYETFRFPNKMESLNDYLNYIRKEKLYSPYYEKESYNLNQIFDFHIDWLYNNEVLLIIEEIDMMEENSKIDLIRLYTEEIEFHKKGMKFPHLIITQQNENGLIKKLGNTIQYNTNNKRTREQVVSQNLKLIDLS